jgi:hypothetical protein
MFAQFLPGFREIRGPLASGFLWLLLGWLVVHSSIAEAHGEIAEVKELGGKLGATPLTAVASFVAYLLGSLSEDVFGRLLLGPLVGSARLVATARQRGYSEDMSESLREAQIVRLENVSDRFQSESDLRVAIIPPLAALIVYAGATESRWWLLGLLLVLALGGQAWLRTKDFAVSSYALYELRKGAGLPPSNAKEAAWEQ